MNTAIILTMIFVVIILVVALILTIKAGNSKNEDYQTEKSFSSLLWAYVLSIPVILIIVIAAIWMF